MENEKELRLAQSTFETLCHALDNMEWRYKADASKLMIQFGVSGEDIPMQFVVLCDAQRQLIRLMSFLPFKMGEDKRIEGAVATNYVNYQLAEGCFDYHVGDGQIIFRMTSSFRESLISPELFIHMIQLACFTVDKYNDRFLMISKGLLSIDDFIQGEN